MFRFPDRVMTDFAVFGSTKVSDTVVEPYNAILALHHLIENVDQVICIDNEALFNQATKKLGIQSPRYSDLNQFATQMMCGVTSSLRFPSHLMTDLRKQLVSLIPFPRLHFFLPSEVPLSDPTLAIFDIRQGGDKTFSDIVRELLEPSSTLVDVDLRAGKIISAVATFRGENASLFEAYSTLSKTDQDNPGHFVNWMPTHWSYAFSSKAPPGLETSATLLQNSTSIKALFSRYLTQFDAMFRRKAFLRPYHMAGLDEMELVESQSNVADLVAEYELYEAAVEEPGGDIEEAF
jgi:tubulin beta